MISAAQTTRLFKNALVNNISKLFIFFAFPASSVMHFVLMLMPYSFLLNFFQTLLEKLAALPAP